ncbi:MAG: hypothetical protein PUF62_09675 [Bacteroidales bacterium]|nr:hypothetical protein [Bacteroidales bacterium]
MIINKELISKNSTLLYGKMKKMYRYTFSELQKLANLESTDLCLALIQLLQENKIMQDKGPQGICYAAV